ATPLSSYTTWRLMPTTSKSMLANRPEKRTRCNLRPLRNDLTPCMSAVAESATTSPGEPEVLDRMRLAGVPGLSPRLVRRILARFGSAGTALRADPGQVAAVPGVGDARST